jgi:hypothetical protein
MCLQCKWGGVVSGVYCLPVCAGCFRQVREGQGVKKNSRALSHLRKHLLSEWRPGARYRYWVLLVPFNELGTGESSSCVQVGTVPALRT